MKTVVLKKDGKTIGMFEAMDIIKDIQVYIAKNEIEKDKTDYYVMYFILKIDNKCVYLVFAEPYFLGVNEPKKQRFSVIEIEELNLEIYIETDTSNAVMYSYSIKDEPIENDSMFYLMLYHLLGKFLDINTYSVIDEPDTVFISEKE